MKLEGSCHCGAVRFSLEAPHPVPFNLCYCSICRKTAGGGGYAINLGGESASLDIVGAAAVRTYSATIANPEDAVPQQSSAIRSFCGECGSALWLFDPQWPELVHPFASAIDTRCRKRPRGLT